MIVQRVLAVLSAALLVGAVALATLGPPRLPLGQALFMFDHDAMQGLRSAVEHVAGDWVWRIVVVPMLVRPAWLIPAGLGLICGGAALSASTRNP
ncbi:MAG: hypothetical protein J0H99_16085, partial [Rhodospirillales bacterium]|nr:hypothetical protein [Rhodospirillales bacterium]